MLWKSYFLCATLSAAVNAQTVAEIQQSVLDAFADQLTIDRGSPCHAPVIGTCPASEICQSTNCGTFTATMDALGYVLAMLVPYVLCTLLVQKNFVNLQQNVLTAIPTEIGLLSKMTHMFVLA